MTSGLPQLFGTGLGLSAAAGLNSYAVLLVYGAMARLFPEDYPGSIARLLSTTPALAIASVLFLMEFVADKIPGLDHFWHLLHSFVRPVVGALVAIAAVQLQGSPVLNVVAGGSGGAVALASHLVKSATRLTSTALTAGIANAGLSLAEDILAFLQSLVSIFLPLVALLVVATVGLLFVLTVPRMARSIDLFGRRRSGGPPAGAAVLVLCLLAAPVARGARPDDVLTNVGAVPREVAGAHDIARLDGETRLDRVLLVLPRRDPESLAALLADLQDPASPNYRRWLAPFEFERRFGASDEDVAALDAWLTSHGLEVENAPAGRAALVFSGRAADVESAFDTELHELFADGRVRIANVRPARLPLGLARRVVGILSLHSFPRRHPLARRVPAFTSGSKHSLAPADFTAIYNVDALLAAGINGSGRTIGLIAQTNVNVADTTYFRQYFGLPANDPVVVLNGPDPGIQSGDDLESDLDIQWAGAVAPSARILLIATASTQTAFGVDLSALYAVSKDLADVVSLSYGGCELEFGDSDTAFYTNIWAQAAAQGISVLVASGDSGPAGCDPAGANALSASVNGLGSSPYATCVGGTQFLDTSNPSAYWNATNDPVTQKSVKGYIPETTWNELSGSTAGGKSILFSRPPWQNVSGLPADNARYVPDVSLAASTRTPYMAVQGHTTSTTGLVLYGGTSLSSPAFAGLAALLSQKAGTRLGNLNPLLYAAGRAQYGAAGASAETPLAGSTPVFHDVTTGDNSVPGVAGFAAGPGYDAATGLGSVDAAALAAALPTPAQVTSDFTLGAWPATPVLPAGGSVVVNLALYQLGSAAADAVATVTVAGVPAGVTAEFRPGNPANTTAGVLSRAEPATLTLRAAGAAAGTYRLDLAATSGPVVRRMALFLTVGSGAATPPTGAVVQAPVVLDVFGAATSHYTSDFVAVNRSGSDATLVLVYVPAAGTPGASGPAVARALPAGRQLYIPDVIAFLAANGWALPSDGSSKLGTFFATFVGVSDPAAVFAGSRTSTPNPATSVGGAFGTFASAVPAGSATGSSDAWIYGLRQDASFRSNLAVVHAPGDASGATAGPVSLEIQLYDGDSGAPVGAPLARTLQPGEFAQYNGVLALTSTGVTNGYARLRRTSGSDRFIAYGVVNDGGSAGGGTSDGSFLVSNATEGLLPIVLDVSGSAHFTSDLTLTNPTSTPVTVTLTYTAASAFSGQGGGTRTTTLAARQQIAQANAISYLRGLGLAIPTTGNQGGTLLVTGAVAQARTSNPNPDTSVGGSYGLSYPAVAASARAKGEAWVYGLRQDADVRTNLAIADARVGDPSTVDYLIELFDTDQGLLTPVETLHATLAGGQWFQFNAVGAGDPGLVHGYARVRPSAGASDFVVYGVVNDGPIAGSRTSDGSYVPMVVTN
jgi:pseudomonalisin